VFIDLYHIQPQHYGWLFGSNACGLILASQINGRFLSRRFSPDRVLATANLVQAGAGLLLLAMAATGFGALAGIIAPLFLYVTCVGFISPNTTVLAMMPFAKNAGAASALLGTLQFALGALAAIVVGASHNATAVPMAAVIACCGVLGVVFHWRLVRADLQVQH
jgi:DHA1 family bicyclomycin/chloramphenicol resistance-like MFS transporter